MRDDFIKEDRSRGIMFDQDFGSMPGVLPVASGGIHVWHMPALVTIFGDDSVLQFGGGTLGHHGATLPAPPPTASRWKPASKRATRASPSRRKAKPS